MNKCVPMLFSVLRVRDYVLVCAPMWMCMCFKFILFLLLHSPSVSLTVQYMKAYIYYNDCTAHLNHFMYRLDSF